LSSSLPLINIYVYTKFNFNPVCTFQDMAQTGNNYEKLLWGDNNVNIKYTLWFLGSPNPHQ